MNYFKKASRGYFIVSRLFLSLLSDSNMLRKLSPNTQVFLGTSGILGFCYYTFFVMGDKNQPKQSVFDQSR